MADQPLADYLSPLAPYFTWRELPGEVQISCKYCLRTWLLVPSSRHPGNVLTLPNHGLGHARLPAKAQSSSARRSRRPRRHER